MRNAGLPSTRGSNIRNINGSEVFEMKTAMRLGNSQNPLAVFAPLGNRNCFFGLTDVGRVDIASLDLFGGNPEILEKMSPERHGDRNVAHTPRELTRPPWWPKPPNYFSTIVRPISKHHEPSP